jgi:hypothetical protein
MTDVTPEQVRIERDLDRTRARMDSRLTDLQERLSPGQIVDDLMAYFRGSDGGDFARNLMASVKNNPLPAALTGIGLTWLMAANGQTANSVTQASPPPSPPRPSRFDDLDSRMRTATEGVMRTSDESDEHHQNRIDDAKGAVLGVARQASDTAASFGQRIQDAVSSAEQSATEQVHDLRDRATDAAGQMGDTVKAASDQLLQNARVATSFVTTLTDNPVALGAIGLAVGALLGSLVPQSEQEEAALGDIADQARKAASDLAQEVVDRGGQVAQKVVDAGIASAKDHGLTGDKSVADVVKGIASGDLVEHVKHVAQDVLKTGDKSLRETGSEPGTPAGDEADTPS